MIARSIQTLQRVEPEYIAADTRVEEETLPGYRAERYFPVNIGDTFRSRYQIITKLGYGVTSTTCLCRDLLYALIRTVPSYHCCLDEGESTPDVESSRWDQRAGT